MEHQIYNMKTKKKKNICNISTFYFPNFLPKFSRWNIYGFRSKKWIVIYEWGSDQQMSQRMKIFSWPCFLHSETWTDRTHSHLSTPSPTSMVVTKPTVSWPCYYDRPIARRACSGLVRRFSWWTFWNRGGFGRRRRRNETAEEWEVAEEVAQRRGVWVCLDEIPIRKGRNQRLRRSSKF